MSEPTPREVICKALNEGHDVDGIIYALVSAGYRITLSAQYEALMAAARALPAAQKIIGDLKGRDVWREYDAICNALRALRAAGIDPEVKP